MENPTPATPGTSEENTQKTSNTVLKGFLIALLIGGLMIPAFMISRLIREREEVQKEAVSEVSSKWGNRQTLVGPFISVPYKINEKTGETRWAHFLPEALNIKAEIKPEKRYRGIYEVVVYSTKISFEGKYLPWNPADVSISESQFLRNEATFNLGISDMRGIEDEIKLNWNGSSRPFNPGVPNDDLISSGISTRLPSAATDSLASSFTFSFQLSLKGSEILYFTPTGKITQINMKSDWPDPSFDGSFLPDSRNITPEGFTASWKVLHLNRNFPQQWCGEKNIQDSAFGINLLTQLDGYQKTFRSVNYAILIIALTFLIFFFVETSNKVYVHPVQYLLVGLGLVIYYTLLLSFSEYFGFNIAYMIASGMTLLLIGIYSRSILRPRRVSLTITFTLALLYGFLFTIIQLTDYALLMGSIGLFAILAIVMYYSGKVNWNKMKI